MNIKKNIIVLVYLLINISVFAQNIGINTTGAIPNSKAMLDIDAGNTSTGLLIPRLTTTQRNAITAPIPMSLLIFNTTTECFEAWNQTTTTWVAFGCIGCTLPTQPSVIIGTSPVTQGDNGVAYSVTNVAGVTYLWTYSGTGFSCSSGCATNSITANFSGIATSGILTVTPSNACGLGPARTFAITVNTAPAFPCGGTAIPVVDVLNPVTGKTWMDRNLGASQVATSSSDVVAYGDLYQWGRCSDGHEKRTSGTTTTLSSTNTPGHGNFIINGTVSPFDWRNPSNNSLWQGVSGTNNPCPSGYRIPTEFELDAERLSWSTNNSAGAFNSPLKLTTGGYREWNSAVLSFVGTSGVYWSSTTAGTLSRFLTYSNSSSITQTLRVFGHSVRCIKN